MPRYEISTREWLERTIAALKDDSALPWDSFPCILWPFSFNAETGYGRIFEKGVSYSASREAWAFAYGKDAGKLYVCHHCDVKTCIRPVHLFLGTARDNALDAHAKGRARAKKGEENPVAKLTNASVIDIRESVARGISQASLARRFSVTNGTVYMIIARKTWRHI